ncbi:DUF3019 domain-containing protein [Shewanella abyssi]|uniref:DUF3019 domain-containing protein n=1 Tax=Shewanella abyssi TaxID=311789 RepID=UPI00200C8455|nr:DUF3019 domain-containing protein [Shewanella abyssi]MCL1049087.1 DUF3019 domain-containing protein [Shewanella abyssi]
MTKKISLCLLFCSSLSGYTVAEDIELLATSLSLSPKICITSKDEEICNVEVVLEWRLLQERSICILSDYKELKKWCNSSPGINSLAVNISADKDIQFVMIDKDTHETLAGVKLKVTQASSPQVRRRYRNPWSLF